MKSTNFLILLLWFFKLSAQVRSDDDADGLEPTESAVTTEKTTSDSTKEGESVNLNPDEAKFGNLPPVYEQEVKVAETEVDVTSEGEPSKTETEGERSIGNVNESKTPDLQIEIQKVINDAMTHANRVARFNNPLSAIINQRRNLQMEIQKVVNDVIAHSNRVVRFNNPLSTVLNQGRSIIEELDGRIIQDIDNIRQFLLRHRLRK